MENNPTFDVAIVGASLAGATTAAILGRSGLSVALIDAKDFPRSKPCGEGLSAIGHSVLTRLGIEYSYYPLSGYQIWSKRGSITIGSELPSLYGVQRHSLDTAVIHKALTYPGVTFFSRRKVASIEYLNDTCVVHSNNGVIYSKILILACGAHTPLHGLSLSPSQRYGVTFRWHGNRNALDNKVQVIVQKGMQWYLTPTSTSDINISATLHTPILDNRECREKAHQLLASFSCTNGSLSPSQGIPSLIRGRRPAYVAPRTFLVGDSCEQLDPLGGMGMTHALLSGEACAETLLSYFHRSRSLEEVGLHYTHLREEQMRPLRCFTKIMYQAMAQYRLVDYLPARMISTFGELLTSSLHGVSQGKTSKLLRSTLSQIGGLIS